MKLTISLLAVLIVVHASSLPRQSTLNDFPIGFSWDESREQVIISHVSGGISFITDPEKPESSEESYVDFGTHSTTPKSPGFEHECHVQAFHKDANGDTLWRIESLADDTVLVGYSLQELLKVKLPLAISHGPVQLPKARYTDVAVSSSGIVFIVDSRGGILQCSPTAANKRSAEKEEIELERTTWPDEEEGTRSIVYHNHARQLIVGTRESGKLIRVDPERQLRESVRIIPGRLPTSPSSDPRSAMDLMLLSDGRLVVLSAGSMYLLREADEWGMPYLSQFRVLADFEVGSEAILLSHASTSGSIFVLCDLHTTDPDSDVPYSIRELSLPLDNASWSSRAYLRLSNTIPIQAPDRYSTRISGVSSVRYNNHLICSYTHGSIGVHDAETFSQLGVFVIEDTSDSFLLEVRAQGVDEFSNIFWRIEHWMESGSHEVTFLVAYHLDQIYPFLETPVSRESGPATPPHHFIQPFEVYELRVQSTWNATGGSRESSNQDDNPLLGFVDLADRHTWRRSPRPQSSAASLLVVPDGPIFAYDSEIMYRIEPLDVNLRVLKFKQCTPITVKEARVTKLQISPNQFDDDSSDTDRYPSSSTGFDDDRHHEPRLGYHSSSMVYHDSGLILLPNRRLGGLIRFDINTETWQNISLIGSPVEFAEASTSMAFLSDGRLMISCSRGGFLLEEVRVDTSNRWLEAHIVASAEPFPECWIDHSHFIFPSPRDHLLALCVSGEVSLRRMLIE